MFPKGLKHFLLLTKDGQHLHKRAELHNYNATSELDSRLSIQPECGQLPLLKKYKPTNCNVVLLQ